MRKKTFSADNQQERLKFIGWISRNKIDGKKNEHTEIPINLRILRDYTLRSDIMSDKI